jgi:hypothetical protein
MRKEEGEILNEKLLRKREIGRSTRCFSLEDRHRQLGISERRSEANNPVPQNKWDQSAWIGPNSPRVIH